MTRLRSLTVFILAMAWWFSLPGATWAAAEKVSDTSQAQEVSDTFSVSDISISPDLGYIVDTRPSAVPSAPLIIHIQEAHTNYEAQQHLADILGQLVAQHGLKLILVEGGHGDVSLAYLRTYGPLENRREVADKYLRLGVLSGEEYLDIVSDAPLVLWGVDDAELHERNIRLLSDTTWQREQFRTPLRESYQDAVDTLRPKLEGESALALYMSSKAFQDGRLGLADYAEFLSARLKDHGIDQAAYPELSRFLRIRESEGKIVSEDVGREQRSLMARLAHALPAERLDALVEQAQGVKAGTTPRHAFYRSLQQAAEAAGIDLREYPKLTTYAAYVEDTAALSSTGLSDELGHAAADVQATFAQTPEAKTFQRIAEEIDLVTKLVDFQLSPAEYERFKTLPLGGMTAGWTSFLSDQLTAAGAPERYWPSLDALQEALPGLLAFYEMADQRNQRIVDNALAKLREMDAPLAVLITGGFHSPVITQKLAEQGVSVVVMAPKITQPTNERLYEAVLRYKSGEGSLAEVTAVAEQAGIPVNRVGGVKQ